MSKRTKIGNVVEACLLLMLAIIRGCPNFGDFETLPRPRLLTNYVWLIVPPCAVACVTGCGMHFVLNLILFLFLTWIGGIIHAICIVVIYGFCNTDMPRQRRKDRLHAQQKDLFSAPAPSPPCYCSGAASTTGFYDSHYAKNVYSAGHANTGSAFAQGSVNTTRDNGYNQLMFPVDKVTSSSTEFSETSRNDSEKDLGEDRKFA